MQIHSIRDFLQAQQPMMLVLGEAQSGKSELLDQAMEQLATSHNAIRFQAKQHLKPRVMIQEIAHQWHIPIEDHGDPFVEQLRVLVNGLTRENREGILLIDDAQLLPYSVLAALIHAATTQGQNCRLRLLLSARMSFHDKVRTLYEAPIALIELGKLPRHLAREHIEAFLEKSHISASKEVINGIVDRLYDESHGIPSRIDKLLRALTLKDFMQFSASITENKKETKAQEQTQRFSAITGSDRHTKQTATVSKHMVLGERGVRGLAVCGLLSTLFGLYWYEHHEPSVSPPMPSKPYHYAFAKTIPLADEQPKSLTPPIKPKLTTAENAHAALASQSGYTIQLMGSFDKTIVEHKQISLASVKTQVFNEQYKQKPWYVLGVGNYKTQKQAVLALHHLPPSLQKMGAWVRPLN